MSMSNSSRAADGMSGLRSDQVPNLPTAAESSKAPSTARDFIPAGIGAPVVRDLATGKVMGLHVPSLDDALHVGVMFRQHTGRGQCARPLMLARTKRDRVRVEPRAWPARTAA